MTTSVEDRIPRWAPVVLYLLTSLVWVSPALVTGGTFGAVDVVEQFAPYQERNADLYRTGMPLQGDQAIQLVMPAEFWQTARSGDLQLWEPDLAGGTPMATGLWNRLLSPFHLTFAVLPARHAPTATAFLGVLVAQLGTHLLARRLGLGRRGAMVAAVGYGFAGPVVSFTHRLHEIWLVPLLLATVDGALTDRGPTAWRWAAGAGVVTASVLLAGFPAAAVMAMYAAGAYALARLVQQRHRGRAAVVAGVRLAVGVAAGGLVAAVQLLPSLEFLDATVLTVRRYGRNAIPLEYLGTAPVGRFLGAWQDDDWWWPELLNPIEGQMTVGLVLLAALGVVALGVRSRRAAPVFTIRVLAVAAVVLLHASFVGGIVQRAFQLLPLLDQSLFTRSRFLASLAIALLAGLAMEHLLDRDRDGAPASWWVRGAGLYVVGLVTVGTGYALLAATQRAQLREVALDGARVLPVLVVVAVLVRMRPRSVAVAFAVPALLAGELLVGAWGFVPTSPPGTFPADDPALDVIADDTGPGGDSRFVDRDNLALYGHTGALLDLNDAMAHWPVPGPYQELFETAGDSVAAASEGKAVFEPLLGEDVDVADSPTLDAVSAAWFLTSLEAPPRSLGPAVAQVPLDDGGVTLDVPDGTAPLRALVVGPIVEATPDCVTGWWEADVTPSSGPTVTVRRTLRNIVPAGFAVFPIPDLTASSLDVELRVDGPCELDDRDAFVTVRPVVDDTLALVGVDGWQAYRRPSARPRLSVATEVTVVPDGDRRLELLATREADAPVVVAAPVGELDATRAEVRYVEDAADEVVVESSADGRALVVLRDNVAPGWEVLVDGDLQELVTVDHAFRGVVVPAGEHEVRFRYSPASLRLGGWLALNGLVLLAGLALWPGIGARLGRRTGAV